MALKTSSSVDGKKVTVIGGGVIGASWTALFLARGMRVTMCDPMPGIEAKVRDFVENALPELSEIGLNVGQVTASNLDSYLIFESDIATAVKEAEYVQENGPEKEDFKADLWKVIEEHAPRNALFLSSSSGITATKQSKKMKMAERLTIGHPFNPPHVMPLVEIVPGECQDPKLIDEVERFYLSLGKVCSIIKKEIPGFVANRLQSAIFRECIFLVQEHVVSVQELDKIVTSSLGIRWATSGPFLSFHLGGGSGGFKHFLEHLAPVTEELWKQQLENHVSYDEMTKKLLLQEISDSYGSTDDIEHLSKLRDSRELAVINTLTEK